MEEPQPKRRRGSPTWSDHGELGHPISCAETTDNESLIEPNDRQDLNLSDNASETSSESDCESDKSPRRVGVDLDAAQYRGYVRRSNIEQLLNDRYSLNRHNEKKGHPGDKDGPPEQNASQPTIDAMLRKPSHYGSEVSRGQGVIALHLLQMGLPMRNICDIFSPNVCELVHHTGMAQSVSAVLESCVPPAYLDLRKRIKQHVANTPLTICFDGSTSNAHNTYYIVVQAAFPGSTIATLDVHVEPRHPNGPRLCELLLSTIREYEIEPKNIAAFMCDNEPVNNNAITSKIEGIDSLVNSIRNVIFVNSASKRDRVKKLEDNNIKASKFNCTDVRWGSKVESLQELVANWESFHDIMLDIQSNSSNRYIESILQMMKEPALQILADVTVTYLTPLYENLEPMQKAFPTVQAVSELTSSIDHLNDLLEQARTNTLSDSLCRNPLWSNLSSELQMRVESMMLNALDAAVKKAKKFLMPNARLLMDRRMFTHEAIALNRCSLHFYNGLSHQQINSINSYWRAVMEMTHVTQHLPCDVGKAFTFWTKRKNVKQEFVEIATRTLARSGSNAGVERAFSVLNRVFRAKHRNSTSEAHQSQQAFVMLNDVFVNQLLRDSVETFRIS